MRNNVDIEIFLLWFREMIIIGGDESKKCAEDERLSGMANESDYRERSAAQAFESYLLSWCS